VNFEGIVKLRGDRADPFLYDIHTSIYTIVQYNNATSKMALRSESLDLRVLWTRKCWEELSTAAAEAVPS
jgi:hypothetical protein